jgi:hypothetical protein
MADIVNLGDYRASAPGPVEVTFFAASFRDEEDRLHHLSYSVRLQGFELGELIENAQSNGGIFIDGGDVDSSWFLPWPCAAVRVRKVCGRAVDG